MDAQSLAAELVRVNAIASELLLRCVLHDVPLPEQQQSCAAIDDATQPLDWTLSAAPVPPYSAHTPRAGEHWRDEG